MRSLTWPDPRVKPPYGTVEVDRSHPLTRGLVGAWLLNDGAGSPIDIVKARQSTTDGVVWTTNSHGLAIGLDVVTDDVNFGIEVADFKPTSVSIGVLAAWSGTGSGNLYIFSSVNAGTGYELAMGTGSFLWWATTTNFNINNTTFTPVANVPFRAVLSYDETIGACVYVNGVQVATDATTGALTYNGAHSLRLGERADLATGMPGEYSEAVIYNRGLTASEAFQLNAEPYAFLRPIIRRRYFVPPAAAATGHGLLLGWRRNRLVEVA